MQRPVMSYKDQGNVEYKKGNWLKAAALYTKGIKEDPENAILYSNRSAALLQLRKSGKALEDAEQCIKRRPDWDKGFYRKGLALELAGKNSEALEAVEKAVACNPDNAEMKRKARDLRKLAGVGVSRTKADKENQVSSNHAGVQQPQTPSLEERPPLKVAQTPAQDVRDSDDLVQFEQECMARASTSEPEASVYFLGERAAGESVDDATSQVKIKEAFATPDNLQNCLGFLRQYAADRKAQASCAVVPADQIAYPQVWKKAGWPLGGGVSKGTFVQLETPKSRNLWFLAKGALKGGRLEAHVLSDDFIVMERLLR